MKEVNSNIIQALYGFQFYNLVGFELQVSTLEQLPILHDALGGGELLASPSFATLPPLSFDVDEDVAYLFSAFRAVGKM